ncbi:MAG: transcriptional repressor [Lachnospiraceae bacterium]|nr:transcriptional repressor [Lachnospiraceae bacterium]
MPAGSTYRTKQREILLKFFEKKPGVHITAGEVLEYMNSRGESIGQATIYRQLEKLVDEGLLNKYAMTPAGPACFEYVGMSAHKSGGTCFHCKCEKCGRLIHMHCDELEGISTHILNEHGFKINPLRTVFYGICEDCNDEK